MKKLNKIMFGLFLFFSLSFTAHAQKPLIIVCDIWPPYQISEGDKITGFSTEIVETVFRRMNVPIRNIQSYPWKRALQMTRRGTADALFSANFTEARTAFAYYPDEPLIRSPWVMWVREKDKLKFDSFDDLKRHRVGIVMGYSYTPEFWNYIRKNADYEEVVNDITNFKKLNAGRIDYALAELGNGLYAVKRLGLKNIIPLMNYPVKSDGLYIIFSKKNVPGTLADRFSSELKQLKKEDLYRKIHAKYFGLRRE